MMTDQQNESNNKSNSGSNSNGNAVIADSSSRAVLYLPVDEIVKDREYSTLIPSISREEYESLKHDIAVNGIKIPLIINTDKILLDGYTRLRIARELGLSTVPCIIRNTQDRLEEQILIITVNANRRHMNTAQKAELALKLLQIEQESARIRQLSALRQYKGNSNMDGEDNSPIPVNWSDMTNTSHNDKSTVGGHEPPTAITAATPATSAMVGRSREVVADLLKISDKTIKKVRRIKERASRDPKIAEYWQEALQGKRSVQAVYERVKEKEAREAMKPVIEEGKRALNSIFSAGNAVTPSSSAVRLVHGDFRDVLKDVPDNSIDLIFTDPPYGEEYLHLVRDP